MAFKLLLHFCTFIWYPLWPIPWSLTYDRLSAKTGMSRLNEGGREEGRVALEHIVKSIHKVYFQVCVLLSWVSVPFFSSFHGENFTRSCVWFRRSEPPSRGSVVTETKSRLNWKATSLSPWLERSLGVRVSPDCGSFATEEETRSHFSRENTQNWHNHPVTHRLLLLLSLQQTL